ncbi:MAG: acyl-phosphate glycerol 3-phosphate acyltransferase [Chloroflexi bacterium RBG_16_56_11]|nr:MAG: acyl-phosphate glycerol 3-phosphate acyltransferase [Chloroflexi bacterium RBG_16_56_11]
MIPALFLAVALIGYLLGSIPFGLLIARSFARTDIREVGSGKIGMTNVLRTAGKKAAALALILDVAKGVMAVLIAEIIFAVARLNAGETGPWLTGSAQAVAALAAIAGHTWSVFLRFKGGRGVSTFIGGLLAMYWPAAIVGGGFMLFIGFRTRYMSLGSIIGAVTAFIMLMAFNILQIDYLKPYPAIEYVTYAMIGAIFIYIMHRDNISRLYNGTERKIGDKARAGTSPSPSHTK